MRSDLYLSRYHMYTTPPLSRPADIGYHRECNRYQIPSKALFLGLGLRTPYLSENWFHPHRTLTIHRAPFSLYWC